MTSTAPGMKIFVVLDPSVMEQVSLDWGEKIARDVKAHRGIDASLHVYCCVNDESVTVTPHEVSATAQSATLKRIEDWVNRLVLHTREQGIDVRTEVEWDENWRTAIVEAAARQNSSLVVKNSTPHAKIVRLVRETSDWRLLRDCECPVLLVKSGRGYNIEKILVAVKHRPEDELYEAANDSILEFSRNMAGDLGASLHAVTCYQSDDRPDRQRFADRCGLERNQVSAGSGSAERVIAETADELSADLLVIARVARPGKKGLLGDTARKLIDETTTDLLVLPMAS